MLYKQSSERGAVSIFVVVFTALLVTVVTASFIQIMLRNQGQATNNDLAQSAYDSALAGVEDAKRALVRLRQCEADAADSCETAIENALNSNVCESLGQSGAKVSTFDGNGEVQVGDTRLNQAYNCVKVQLDTDSVEDALTADDDTKVVPLRGVSDFDSIRLSWFKVENMPSTGASPTYSVNAGNFVPAANWPDSQPSVMRAQLIQFSKGDISLSNFDGSDNPYAKTKFLFPSNVGLNDTSFTTDNRFATASRNDPYVTRCMSNFNTTDHLCSVTISLPAMPSREAYLQLASFYNDTNFKVELLNGGAVVRFDNVQPIADATGRASDLFRRVKARISVSDAGSQLQFPDAALNVRSSLCKDFFVTDNRSDYLGDTDNETCDPAS